MMTLTDKAKRFDHLMELLHARRSTFESVNAWLDEQAKEGNLVTAGHAPTFLDHSEAVARLHGQLNAWERRDFGAPEPEAPKRYWKVEDGETHWFVQPTLEALLVALVDTTALCDEDEPHVEVSIAELTEEQARAKIYADNDEAGTALNLADSPIGTYISTVY